MWFDIIYEEPKCNIDISDSVVQWLGRDKQEGGHMFKCHWACSHMLVGVSL